LTLQIQVSLKLTKSCEHFNLIASPSENGLQPNQAPTPIGCLIFKELANQGLAFDLPFRVSGEAAHCTDFNFCVNSF
jgi:hypothetical protein